MSTQNEVDPMDDLAVAEAASDASIAATTAEESFSNGPALDPQDLRRLAMVLRRAAAALDAVADLGESGS